MSWVAVGVAGTTAAVKIGANIKRKHDLKKRLGNLTESTYIPPDLNQALSNANIQANASRYAGQDTDEANIRNASNAAISNAQRASASSANLLNTAGAIQANQNQAMSQVGKNLQGFRMNNNNNFNSLLLQRANQQRANRQQYLAAKSALLAGIDKSDENMVNAVGEGAETFASIYSGGMPTTGQRPNYRAKSRIKFNANDYAMDDNRNYE